jgi:hypothetical protein
MPFGRGIQPFLAMFGGDSTTANGRNEDEKFTSQGKERESRCISAPIFLLLSL